MSVEHQEIAESIRAGTRLGRQYLNDTLRDWANGRLKVIDVVNECEAIWDSLDQWPHYSENDPRSVGVAVLELLAAAHVQLIVLEDIPVIETFLATESDVVKEAHAKFHAYWDGIDWSRREGTWER